MKELKSDLLTAIDSCNAALEEIKDLQTREACQAVLNLTIDNILNRIDTELLEMEKQQIVEAFIGYDSDTEDNLEVGEQYYNETFKSE